MFRHMLNGFMAGEIDPHMHGRTDTEQYAYGLELCENFVPINEGPLVKRPGFEYIRDADATASWLSAFRFSIEQEYVIEWGEEKARFFTNGVRIETSPGVAYEIATPYAADEARYLSTAQSYDRLYIDHADHPPAALSRLTATTFQHDDIDLVKGPFLDQNSDTTKTVTASGVSGTITVTASDAIFAAGMVGSPIEIEAEDFSDLPAWEPGMAEVEIGDVVRNEGNAYTAASAGTTGSSPPVHSHGTEWDGQNKSDLLNEKGPYGVKWTWRHGKRGIATITSFASATSVGASVVQRLPDSVTSVATHRWALGAFSEAMGWPSVVVIGFGRLVHFKDFDIHGSVVGDYGGGRVSFARYTENGQTTPDMAFRRTIATEDPVLWAVQSNKKFVCGTASKELAIGTINSSLALAGDNISADPQSFYGSQKVWPVLMGTSALFVERGARRIRAADYDFGRDRFDAPDWTASARNITLSGIIQLAHQRQPWAMTHGVRSDGQIAVHCNTRLDIKGFARTVPGGAAKILSAVSVVGADGVTDELWCLIERTRADGVKREMWRQVKWRELGDARDESFFVDAGVRTDASAGQTHFSGLTHLAGQDVAVLANGGVVPNMTVADDGTLDLPEGVVPDFDYVMIVGLKFTARAMTLRPEVRQRGETVQGLRQRAVKAVMRVLETFGLSVGDYDGPLEEITDRSGGDRMDAGVPLFTGDSPGDIDGQFDRRGQLQWRSDDPLPCIITAAMLALEVDQSNA